MAGTAQQAPACDTMRVAEFALCLLTLPLWGGLTLLLALLVRACDGAPALFRQPRAGLYGKPFDIIKLRTMRPGDAPDHQRLTRLGRLLRRTSLDELPQLWLVLNGTMALVGPRPLHLRYLPRYTPEQARRHEVRPGITGWAQVRGRNARSWDERFRLDVWYVDNRTFWLDLRILLLTLKTVCGGRGVMAASDTTMEEFGGRPTAHADTPAPRCGRAPDVR